MVVLDSDVVIDYFNGKSEWEERIVEWAADRLLAVTVITKFEVMRGVDIGKKAELAERFFNMVEVFWLDEVSLNRAIQIARDLEKKGQRIGAQDCLIAGIVMARDKVLLTRNRRHFERIPGLSLY